MMEPTPFILFISQRSPFARRIRLALRRLKLPHEEKIVDVFLPTPELLNSNPLGMVPTLLVPEGLAISDSANILEYLHERTGGIWPDDFYKRSERRQACIFAEGVIHSGVLYFQESILHEVPSPYWIAEHLESITRALEQVQKMPLELWLQNGDLTQAGWDLAVGLEYCELRIPHFKENGRSNPFEAVLKLARQNPDFVSTTPQR